IGAAEIVVDGQVFRTRPIRIEVVHRTGQQMQQQRPRSNPAFPGMPSEEEITELDDMFNQMLQDRLRRFGFGGQAPNPNTDAINDNDLFFIDVEVDKRHVYEGEQILVSYYIYSRGRITEIDTLKYPTLVGFWKEDIELATRLNFQPAIINGVQYNRALL